MGSLACSVLGGAWGYRSGPGSTAGSAGGPWVSASPARSSE